MASGGAGGHFSKDEAVHMEMDVQVSRPTEMSADNSYVASAHFSSRS